MKSMTRTLLILLCLSIACKVHSFTSAVTTAPRKTETPRGLSSLTSTTTTTTTSLKDPVILFDGVCNFCNTWVDILLCIDRNKRFLFAPLQSSIGQDLLVQIGKEADDISSVVLIDPTTTTTDASATTTTTSIQKFQYYDKSACVLRVVQELGWVAAVAVQGAQAIVPEELRDGIYDVVAENRYQLMGKRDECRCSDPEFADRFLA